MSESEPQPVSTANDVYSRDYWDIVFAQVSRRPSAMLSLVLLVALYAVAIFAPFLANDRPLVLEAIDRGGYASAQKRLRPISLNLKGMVRDGQSAYMVALARRRAEREAAGEDALGVDVGYAAALGREGEAIRTRMATMRSMLALTDQALLDQVDGALERAIAAAVAGRQEQADAAAQELSELTKRVRSELTPAADGAEPVPGETVALHAVVSYPALEIVTRAELYFMLLWLFLMFWPLWNPLVNRLLLRGSRERIRIARRWKVAVVVLLPLLALPFWSDRQAAFETGPYKGRLTSGEMVATRVVFVPVAFGFAEVNDAEYFRPPTWHELSEITEEGYYARGPRADAVTAVEGFVPPPQPVEVRAGEPDRNAVSRHALGTDSLGRDLVSRMIWGSRVSLSVGLVSTVFLVIIGTVLGSLAGYYGGWVDLIISRVIEVVQCFPVFFLILIVIAFTEESGVLYIMVTIGLFRWTGVARLVRGEFIRLRGQDFVVASEALGVPDSRTIFRHVLPNAMGPVLVAATFAVASGILTESALSFLGFGIQAPIPSWGSLIQESRSAEHWWVQIFPGLFIFLTVVLYNLFGEGLRDALDPRIKKA